MVYVNERGSSDAEICLWARKAWITNIFLYQSALPGLRLPFKALGDGLFELRFKVDNIQHRPIGCCGIERGQFTFLVGATKKQGKRRKDTAWNPPNAIQIAKKRRDLIRVNRSLVREYQY